MVDENQQQNNTNQQSGELTEEQQTMTDSTVQINANDTGNEVNQQSDTQTETVLETTAANQDSNVTATAETTSYESKAKDTELTQQIESLKAQLEERSTQYMRIAADFENYRKRNQKEKEDLEQQSSAIQLRNYSQLSIILNGRGHKLNLRMMVR